VGAIKREYLGKVVRIENLGHGRRGISIEILMTIYLGGQGTLR